MADKSTRWSFTAYEGQYPTIESLAQGSNELIAEIGWQDEVCPKTQKKHRQGYIRTVRQVRFKQLADICSGVHLEKAKNWSALVNYCKKEASRDMSGSQVHAEFEKPMRLHEMLIEVASQANLEKALVGIDRQTDRQVLLRILRDYSQHLVRWHPEYAPVLVRQDARDAWCNFIEVWKEKAGG